MPQRIVFGKGLGRADVERRSAKRTVLKCPHQRILHDGGATPHVDQHGMGGKQGDPPRIDDAGGLIGTRKAHDECIDLRKDGLELPKGMHLIIDPLDTRDAAAAHPDEPPRAQCASLACEGGTDVPGAQHADRRPLDAALWKVRTPDALHLRLHVRPFATPQHEQEHDDVLADGRPIGTGVVGEQTSFGEQGAIGINPRPGTRHPSQTIPACGDGPGRGGEEDLGIPHPGTVLQRGLHRGEPHIESMLRGNLEKLLAMALLEEIQGHGKSTHLSSSPPW